jgi:non-homologous end joining protein Ku
MAARVKKRTDTSTNRESDKIITRLPKGMRAELARLASQSGRSVNAEVVRSLTQHLSLQLGVKPAAEAANEGYLLSEHGLYQISKRLEAGVGALEQLLFDVRDRRIDDGSEQEATREQWRGYLRLSLVTCPVTLIAAADPAVPPHVVGTREGFESTVPNSTHTIQIDQFVPRSEINPVFILCPYYLVPDGRVGHDAFAVIRETIRATSMVAICRVVLKNRERLIALDAHDEGMVGMLLRYSEEVRDSAQYFDNIQNVKVTQEMLDLSKHIVERMSGHFEPDKQVESLLAQEKNSGTIASDETGSNVISLMDALKKSAENKSSRAWRRGYP